MANVNAVRAQNRSIGYANFQGTNNSNVPFMLTIFFDIDTVLSTNLMQVEGLNNNDYSFHSGAFGMYVYNMDGNYQEQTRFFSASPTVAQGKLSFSELEYTDGTGVYQDQIEAYVGSANFLYWEGNGGTGVDTTSTIDTALGNTVRTAGFPFPVTPPANGAFIYSPSGPLLSSTNPINGNIHSTGILTAIPEPSSALMLGAAGSLALVKRRRKTA